MRPTNLTTCTNTPDVRVLDNRGLTVRDIAYHRHPDAPDVTTEHITRLQFDARGFLSQCTDPRLHDAGLTSFTYLTDLAGSVLRAQGADNGISASLNDAAGRPFIAVSNIRTANNGAHDSSQAVTRTWQYEGASLPGRPLSMTEQATGEAARITERFIYAGNSDAEMALNLTGQCVSHYDTAGMVQTDSISLTGLPLSVTRRLLKDVDNPDNLADWQGTDASGWSALLEGETHTTLTTADATGATLTTTDAKGHQQRVAYDVAGLLSGSWLTIKGGKEQTIVQSLTYSAAGQKLREEHGNGVVTTYTYEPETHRLTGIKTERPTGHASGAKILQDLRYEYDPVGNVLSVRNNAEETRFWRNQKVIPENTYTYDSLYQLISATGREMANVGQQGNSLPSAVLNRPGDSSAYTSYTRTYTYDRAGNLTQIRHSAPATNNNYTTKITISDRSNRGVLSMLTEKPSEVDALFTAGGQQMQLLPGQQLTWTLRDELLNVSPVQREEETDDRESYRYDAGSQRVLKVSRQKTGNSIQTQRVLYLPGLERRTTATGSSVAEDLSVITVGEAGRAQVRVLQWESGKPEAISNGQVRYSYDNIIGSGMLELDSVGDIISLEEYYPYGGTAIWTARSTAEADYKTTRYSGKERDATGLYYYGYRYYQPWAGRWLSADPAGTEDGLNLFRMVQNNPVILRDKNGLNSELLYSQAFKRTAKKYNVIIGVRAPNPLGETLLKEGFPSKNFHMKAKSSPTGPTAGFIAEDPIYSKVSPSAYKKQSSSIEKAKSMGAESLNLFISNSRVNELLQTGNLTSLGENRYSASYPSGIQNFIIGSDGKVLNSDGGSVKVMTNPPEVGEKNGNKLPITADYDLFAIIPSINQAFNERPMTVPQRLLRGNFSLGFTSAKSKHGKSEDVNMGNLHHYGKVIVNNLNKEISNEGYNGGKLVWHNDETGNPFSPGFDENDKPIFFLPSGDVFQANSKSELLGFYSRLKGNGYAPENSPIFGF
jgi:insecticidal toxin complex protein TccC